MPVHSKNSADPSRPVLVNVVASSLMVGLLQGQLQFLHDRGFDVTVIAPQGNALEEVARSQQVRAIELPMVRKIAPLQDLLSLWHLWRTMRAIGPVVTNVGTPKAGLLGGLVASLIGVPCRFYTLRGLRFETTKGVRQRLLVYMDRLACRLAHRVICVSSSVREKAIAFGLTSRDKTVVFGGGSSNGVDASRFAPTPEIIRRATELRYRLGIPLSAPVVGFVGRLTRDKGVPELVEAFLRLGKEFPDLRLLLLGRFEEEDPLPAEIRRCVQTNPRVILVEQQQDRSNLKDNARAVKPHVLRREEWPVEDTVPYYAMMDVFVLPSHREGLPNVVLEAQAAGKPVVGARATGVVDAVQDGETGLLFPRGNAVALADAVKKLLGDKEFARKLALAGQGRVMREFRQEQIWEALYHEYLKLMRTRDLPCPRLLS